MHNKFHLYLLLLLLFILANIASFNLSYSSLNNQTKENNLEESNRSIQKYYPFHFESFFQSLLSEVNDEVDVDDELVNENYSMLCPSNPLDMILYEESCFFQYNELDQNESNIKIGMLIINILEKKDH